jgi:thiol-disulfide isomerase/thioredoxin
MYITRSALAWFTIVALHSSSSLAQDNAAIRVQSGNDSFKALKQEYDEATTARRKRIQAARELAKKEAKEQEFQVSEPSPSARFSPRFLAIAQRNPHGAEAIDALTMTLLTSNGPKPGTALETRAKALKVLRDHYADKPTIMGFLKTIVRYRDDDSKALVAKIIADNPDRKVQVAAYKEQIAYRESLVLFAGSFKDAQWRETMGKGMTREFELEQTAMAERSKIELEGLRKALRENYSDLYNELSVGYPAPELKMQAVDGKEATLSSLRGKVVVLDIWATWCGPCKAMIPHEREMAERLKDKPFQLVGISIDSEARALKEFLAKERLPWTQWCAGTGGLESTLAQEWDIRSIPAIFVLDTKGVVRYKAIRGEELEKAVNALLEETVNPGQALK